MMKQMRRNKKISVKLLLGEKLNASMGESFFLKAFQKKVGRQDLKSILLLLSKKGESDTEILGCVKAIRSLEPPRHLKLPFLMDVCGTGGDGQGTFNVSTISGFVIAAAGGSVAKHGNRSVSSRVGSSDLIEALGIRLDIPAKRMFEALESYHFGYFHAPLYHPIFASVQALRQDLGIRTLFNSLGPMVNPVELDYQIVGVSDPRWLKPLAITLSRLPRVRAAAFRSEDGLDELSTGSRSDIFYIERGIVKRMQIHPEKYGFSKAKPKDYQGGDLKTNRGIALKILSGRMRGPREEIVLLNSGFALRILGLVNSLSEGVEYARCILRRGIAFDLLQALRRFTQDKPYDSK